LREKETVCLASEKKTEVRMSERLIETASGDRGQSNLSKREIASDSKGSVVDRDKDEYSEKHDVRCEDKQQASPAFNADAQAQTLRRVSSIASVAEATALNLIGGGKGSGLTSSSLILAATEALILPRWS